MLDNGLKSATSYNVTHPSNATLESGNSSATLAYDFKLNGIPDGDGVELDVDLGDLLDDDVTVRNDVSFSATGGAVTDNTTSNTDTPGDGITVVVDDGAQDGSPVQSSTVTMTVDVDASDASTDNRVRVTVDTNVSTVQTRMDTKTVEPGTTTLAKGNADDPEVFHGETLTVKSIQDIGDTTPVNRDQLFDARNTTVAIYALANDGSRVDSVAELSRNTLPGDTINIDTSDLTAGSQYQISLNGTDNTLDQGVASDSEIINFTLIDMGLTAEADSEEVDFGDDITFTVSGNQIAGDTVSVALKNDDDNTLATDSDSIGGDGTTDLTFTADYSDVSDGDEVFLEVTHDASEVTAESGNVTVNQEVEAENGTAAIANSPSVTQGNVADITVELSGNDKSFDATLVIGSEEDNYELPVRIVDGDGDADDADGEVTLEFNTYAAGTSTSYISAADSDDAVYIDAGTNEPALNELLASGSYDLAVRAGNWTADEEAVQDNPDDLGTLTLTQRDTEEEMTQWEVNRSGIGSLDEVGEIAAEVEAGNITEDSDIALDTDANEYDQVIYELNTEGIDGAWQAAAGDNATAKFVNLTTGEGLLAEEINFYVEQQNPGPNAEAKNVALKRSMTNGGLSVLYDNETETIYVMMDYGDVYVQEGTDATTQQALSDTRIPNTDNLGNDRSAFEATFNVSAEDGIGPDNSRLEASSNTPSAEIQLVEGTLTLQKADGTALGSDTLRLAAVSDQSITATTNYAPATDFTYRLRSTTTGQNFFKTPTVITNADGDLTKEFDLSALATGTQFDLSIRKGTVTYASAEAEIPEAAASMQLDTIDAPSAVVTGDTVVVDVTVTNNGDAEGTDTVSWTVAGDEVASQEVTLGAGESTTLNFSITAPAPGEYDHTVSFAGQSTTQTLTVTERATITYEGDAFSSTSTSTVSVDSVFLPLGGYVVIHNPAQNNAVVGNTAYLPAGTHENVQVPLNRDFSSGLDGAEFELIAMAHKDTDGDQTYDFPDADGPYVTADGNAVVATGTIQLKTTSTTTSTTTTTEPTTTTPTPTPWEEGDLDGDGVPNGEDYAPNDPDVQDREDAITTRTVVQTTVVTETVTVTVTPEDTTTTTTGGGIPGFTAGIALVALAAAALLALRREREE